MINDLRYIWQLLVIASLIVIIAILVIPATNIGVQLNHFLVTVGFVTVINLASFLVLSAGIRKGERDGTMFLLAGIGLKFILYLFYILAFWLVTKNLSKPFIISFFALYLVFTIFLAVHLFKLLKNK